MTNTVWLANCVKRPALKALVSFANSNGFTRFSVDFRWIFGGTFFLAFNHLAVIA